MKVVKKTGLVPVHTKQEKRIFGVFPAIALKGVADGTLFLVDIPEDVETFEFAAPALQATEEPVEADAVLDIPADWETLHWAKQVVIAKQILGVDDLPEVADKKPAEVAKDVIREELARRTANETTPAE